MNTQIQLRGKQLDGTDYNYVYGDGNPIQNANELKASVASATANFYATGRMQTVLIGPGEYNMNFSPLEINSSIKLEGLSDDQNSVKILSCSAQPQNGAIAKNGTDLANLFNQTYSTLVNQGYQFNAETSESNEFLFARSGFTVVKLSKLTGLPSYYPVPSGYNIFQIFVDKISNNIYAYGYSFSLSTNVFFKLNDNITIDVTFSPIAVNSNIRSIAYDNYTGGVFITGYFNTVGGYSRNRLAKLNPDGTLDLTFDPGSSVNSNIESITFEPINNRLIVAGFFNNYNGNSVQYLAAIDGTTAAYVALPGQTAPFNSPVNSVYYNANLGKIIASGSFSSYNSTSFNRALKMNLDGSNPENIFLSVPNFQLRLYSNFIFGVDGYVYAMGSNYSYDGTNYTNGSVLQIDISNGGLVNVLSVSPNEVPIGGGFLFSNFFDQNGSLFFLLPYYVSSDYFTAINVNIPNPFQQVFLRNLRTYGILINNNRLVISNVYLFNYTDIDYANKSLYVSGSYGIEAQEKSIVSSANVSSGDFIFNSSELYINQSNTFLQSNGYYSFMFKNGSRLNNAFNYSTRCNIGQINFEDSIIENSFNGFCNTPYSQNNNYIASTLNSLDATNSIIIYSFNNTVTPQIGMKDCYVESAINLEGGDSGDERNYYVSWRIRNTNGAGSLYFQSGKTNTNYANYIGNIEVVNCNFTQKALYFKSMVDQTPGSVFFSNVHVTEMNQTSIGIYLIPKDANWNQAYNWYNGVIFDNCSVTNRFQWDLPNVDALSIIIDESYTTPGNLSELLLQNFSFNNCHVRTNGGLNNALNIAVFSNQRGITLSNINYTDCSVSTRTGSYGSFIRSLYSTTFINVNNVQFDNCSVRGASGQNLGFLSYIESSGGYDVNFSSINFSNCYSSSANSFITNVTCANFLIDSTNFDNCTSGDYSFISNINSSQWTQSGAVNFNDCHAGDSSFVSSLGFAYIPYTPTFNFKHCSAKQYSFLRATTSSYIIINCILCSSTGYSFGISYYDFNVGPAISIGGYMDNCSTGEYAFTTDWGSITFVNPMYINNCSTRNSILSTSGYSGTFNS